MEFVPGFDLCCHFLPLFPLPVTITPISFNKHIEVLQELRGKEFLYFWDVESQQEHQSYLELLPRVSRDRGKKRRYSGVYRVGQNPGCSGFSCTSSALLPEFNDKVSIKLYSSFTTFDAWRQYSQWLWSLFHLFKQTGGE